MFRVRMRQLEHAEGNIGEALDMLSNQILRAAKMGAERFEIGSIRLRPAWGDPAQSIIETVAREAADALVVGRRGRGRLAGLLLGSVSQKIASLAPCMVVIVP